MSPDISIIVPVYKVEEYLHRCIDSILSQTFTNFECIIVDDCSPDKCPEICDNYAKSDARVKIIHKVKNEGLPQARKTGFENSNGAYIQFVDSDDWIEPDMAEKLYAIALKTNADIVVCDFYNNKSDEYNYGIQYFDTDNHFNNFGFIHCCAVWNKFFRREIITHVEFPKFGKYEDRVITQQAIFYAKEIIKLPIPLYHYFYNNESMSRKNDVKMYFEWRENILFVINFLKCNLKEKYFLKENHINNYVNNFKLMILKNMNLKQKKYLLNFYPESGFKKWLFFYSIKKTLEMIIPHGLFLFYKKNKITIYHNK